jgi:hypothetical protein
MVDFFLVLVTHAALVSLIFLLTSLSASYFLFNSPHGAGYLLRLR